MIIDADRYDRQIALFGQDGQNRLRAARVGIVGLGGLGSPIAQQMAYLGVVSFVLVDGDHTSNHSLNRQVSAYPGDAKTLKTDLAERMIRAIQPETRVINIPHDLPHTEAETALQDVTLILGGVDHDTPRLRLTDFASTHRIVYIDAATDIHADAGSLDYGGRIVTAGTSPGCLFCLNLLDQQQIRQAAMAPEQRAAEAAIYGVPRDDLKETGPSVVTLNGVVASLATTEAMVHLTGLRTPTKHLVYYGHQGGVVRTNLDPPALTCPYCARWLTYP
jgi:molybdopterin-synthase adenylyltransferase